MSAIQQMFFSGGQNGKTLMQAITDAGLTSNLQFALDAGDSASYTSGTKWLDRSGNGFDFFLGTDGSTNAPTFTGVAGNRGSYWAFDGSTFFRYDTTNEAAFQLWHRNNAAVSFFTILYGGTNSNLYIAGDVGTPGTGIRIFDVAGLGQSVGVHNAGANAKLVNSDTDAGAGSWHTEGWSLNEATGAGGGFMYLDGNYNQVGSSDTFDSTYSSPSAGNATNTFEIGALGAGTNPMGNGTKMAMFAAWSTALTKANFDALRAALIVRY